MRRLLRLSAVALALSPAAACKRTTPHAERPPAAAQASAPALAPPDAGGELPPGHPPPLDSTAPAKAEGELPPGHPQTGGEAKAGSSTLADQHRDVAALPAGVTVKPVARAPGPDGHTVQEIWQGRAALAGKSVAVRAQVVKSTEAMDRHFLHLRDGTGAASHEDDLTVTSAEAATVGEVVTARGTVAVDVDLGAGYRYPVLLQDTTVSR